MFHLGADKATQGKDDATDEGAEAGDLQGAAGVEIGENAAQENVQGNRKGDLFGDRQPDQRPVQGIENGGLAIGQKGDAQEKIWIPKRLMSLAHGCGSIVSIGVKVGENVYTGEDEVGEEDLPKENEGQQAQSQEDCETSETSAHLTGYGFCVIHFTPVFVSPATMRKMAKARRPSLRHTRRSGSRRSPTAFSAACASDSADFSQAGKAT